MFCGNDAMAMGAYQALVSAGKADKVKVFGFDGADDVVKLIAEKKIAATGMQFPKVMAQKAAEFADEYIKGKRDFQQKIPVKVELVTPENVSKYGVTGRSSRAGFRLMRPLPRLIAIATAGVCWRFPLLPRCLAPAGTTGKAAGLQSQARSPKFWSERLLKSLDQP